MSLNRFYLTAEGWVPEGPRSMDATAGELLAADALIAALPGLDETAVSPPLAALAWRDSPPSHVDAMAGDAPAMAAYLRQMTY